MEKNQLEVLARIVLPSERTRYSKEFGTFLKKTYGDIPRDLPYA